MATGGFRSNTATDFLEEWKAKREKMRAKMPGGISASTGSSIGALHGGSNKNETRSLNPATEAGGGAPERAAATVTCAPYHPAARAAASCEPRAADGPPATLKKASQLEKVPGTSQADAGDNDRESPAPGGGTGKNKEKKSSGPSARKGKGQIEKRKLREKRRSTGVVSIPSNEVSPSRLLARRSSAPPPCLAYWPGHVSATKNHIRPHFWSFIVLHLFNLKQRGTFIHSS